MSLVGSLANNLLIAPAHLTLLDDSTSTMTVSYIVETDKFEKYFGKLQFLFEHIFTTLIENPILEVIYLVIWVRG